MSLKRIIVALVVNKMVSGQTAVWIKNVEISEEEEIGAVPVYLTSEERTNLLARFGSSSRRHTMNMAHNTIWQCLLLGVGGFWVVFKLKTLYYVKKPSTQSMKWKWMKFCFFQLMHMNCDQLFNVIGRGSKLFFSSLNQSEYSGIM